MYNGQEAVIIRCSDVGWPLKPELALTGTVCQNVGLCGSYSASSFHLNPINKDAKNKSTETNQ